MSKLLNEFEKFFKIKKYRILSIHGGSFYMAIFRKNLLWYAIANNIQDAIYVSQYGKKYEWFYGDKIKNELETYHLDHCTFPTIQECREAIERHRNSMSIKVIEKL